MNIAIYRQKANMTQVEMAKAVGVTQPTVSAWENGEASPAGDKLPLLAKTLNCTIDDLFRKE